MSFLHTSKVALIPSAFFDPASSRELLSQTVKLDKEDKVGYISLPEFSAELVYSLSDAEAVPVVRQAHQPVEAVPELVEGPVLYQLLKKVPEIKEHNKIVASYAEGLLELVIAQGEKLLLANVFQAADFTTAEYFLFMAVRKLQLNPEVSTVHFMTPLSGEEEMSLYRYFKSVETL